MTTSHELQSDFESAVIERSHDVPVLVDFWAAWCGPCRTLGPVLESLAARAEGRWELVKVDTEAHQDVAARYAIRSIPAVKLFHRGEVVADFVGALPEPQIQMWLRQHLPGPADEALSTARRALAAGDHAAARAHYETALELEPGLDEAHFELGRLLLAVDVAAARAHLEAITGDADAYERAQHLLHLIDVTERVRDLEVDPANEAAALYREAAVAFARGDLEAALDGWIAVVERDRTLDDDGARRACIALFSLLGEDHPLVQEKRRRFSMALSV